MRNVAATVVTHLLPDIGPARTSKILRQLAKSGVIGPHLSGLEPQQNDTSAVWQVRQAAQPPAWKKEQLHVLGVAMRLDITAACADEFPDDDDWLTFLHSRGVI